MDPPHLLLMHVAFAIPVQSLLTVEAFAYGSIMGIVACIATKVCSGICMGKPRFVIGWAMVGRAEFAYLIAEMAKSGGILGNEMFAIVVWALLYATIIAPIVFKKVLTNYIVAETEAEGGDVEAVKNTMSRCKTMNLHLPDVLAESEKAEHEHEHTKVADLESKLASQQEAILALQTQLFAIAPAGATALPVLMGKTAAPQSDDAIKKEEQVEQV